MSENTKLNIIIAVFILCLLAALLLMAQTEPSSIETRGTTWNSSSR